MEALTIKTFETSKISAAKVSENRSKDFKCKSVTFAYDGEEVPPITGWMGTSEFLSLKTRMGQFTLW